MKNVIVTVTNDLVADNRMHKICESLHLNGYSVTLLGRQLPSSKPVKREYLTKRWRLFFNKGFLFYAEYNIRLFFYLLFRRYDLYYAVDLDTILPHVFISKLRNKPLIYDAHEYFPEVPELVNRKRVKKIWEKIEEFSIRKANIVITVSDGIAEIFRKKYRIKVNVIRNVPKAYNCMVSKYDKPLVLYQGSINVHRGLENLIKSMKYLPEEVNLWIIGDGDIYDDIKLMIKKEKSENRIKLLGKVPLEKLKQYTCLGWVGVSLEENVGMSYRLALPNKLFDYIQAEIPVLVSDLPEMKKIVNQFQIGEILKSQQPEQIALHLRKLLFDTEKRSKYSANIKKVRKDLVWEKEQLKLLQYINKVK